MRAIFKLVRNLGPGLLLIAFAASILLYSDLGSRGRFRASAAPQETNSLRIAIVQHASTPALDDGVQGILDALDSRGYSEGGRLEVRR